MAGRRGGDQIKVTERGETIKGWIANLEEAAGPHYKTTVQLEALLRAAFLNTQARTHIITGSLKASGKTDSDFDGDVWTGTITYGGALWKTPAPGPPNDPVDYAIYEMARGGDHDFFGDLIGYENQIDEIIHGGFPG